MNKKAGFPLQALIVISFLLLSYLAVIQVDYGMIYFMKARFFSVLSLIICFYGFLIQANSKEQLVDKSKLIGDKISETANFRIINGQKLLWIGLSIYTLNMWFILFVGIVSTVLSNYFNKRVDLKFQPNAAKSSSKAKGVQKHKLFNWGMIKNLHYLKMIKSESLNVFLIVFIYACMDFFREYSVWHTFEIRMFPKISLIIAVIVAIWGIISPKKSI